MQESKNVCTILHHHTLTHVVSDGTVVTKDLCMTFYERSRKKKRKHLTSIWNPLMKHPSSVVLASEVKTSSLLRSLHFMSDYLVRYVTCCAIKNAYTFNIFCTCQKYQVSFVLKIEDNGRILILDLKHMDEAMYGIRKRQKKYLNLIEQHFIVLDEVFNQIVLRNYNAHRETADNELL